jgi:glycosyltransferase involved in cell wall biosynthesis
MKYWLLTTEYPPFYGGGISTYCDQTSKMLAGAGHDVTVFIPHFESLEQLESHTGNIRVIRFNPNTAASVKFLGYEANLSYSFSETISREIKAVGKPDIIEIQEYLGIGYYLLQKKHLGYPDLQDIRVVLTLHAPTFLYLDYNQVPVFKHPNFWVGEMERFCIRAADIRISPSAYLVNSIKDRVQLDDLDTHVLANPFESEYLVQELPPYTPQEIVFYGKLIPQKGCIELLRYFKKLWDEGSNIPLRLIGGGSHLFYPANMDLGEFLKQKYQIYFDRGLLIFEGQIKPDELYNKLSRAHVILIPSIVDNLPYTVLEAMSIGKLVFASRQGGQSEVIEHGEDGFLFDHFEEGCFERTLKQILALSEEKIKEIGRKAKSKISSTFNHARICEMKIQLLQNGELQKTTGCFPLIRPAEKNVMPFEPGKKLLTVVVPYYNMGAYLPETIQSIITSQYKKISIIIVNDGSDDPMSLSVLKQYENQPGVSVIHKANEGLALARNTGAAAAEGEFLAFLDPDDTVEPDYYKRAVDLLLQKVNISFVGCWAKYFGESTDTWPTFNPEPPYALLHNCLNTSALVYKTKHFLDSGLNDARMIYGMEDYESMINMLSNGYRGVAFPETWWNYRIRKNSMAQSFTLNSQLYLYKQIAQKHAKFYGQYASDLFMLLNSNGPSLTIDNPTLHSGIYSKFAQTSRGQKLIFLVKKNKKLRSIAIRVYKIFVK